MAKRQYTGLTTTSAGHSSHCSANARCRGQFSAHNSTKLYKNLCRLAKNTSCYFWTAFNTIEGNYLAICTLIAVLVLSLLLPDLSNKVHVSKEVKNIQKVLDLVSKEVNRAEVACLTAADEICCLQYSVRDGATETFADVRDLSVCTSCCMRTTRSEPVQVEKKIGHLRKIFLPHRNTSHKEIAIMSYVYTNSFDADAKKEKLTNASTLTTDIIY